MRKFITIVGVGERRLGVKQSTGKPYDFTPISFTYDDPYCKGFKAATAKVSQDCMSSYTPQVGDTVEVVMREDFRTGSVYVDAVL